MLTRARLAAYQLESPVTADAIAAAEQAAPIPFPAAYKNLLSISNGLYSDGCLALHPIEALMQRNHDYEVHTYLPDYYMIGDDSGGQAILIDRHGIIYEVGMGVMDAAYLEKSADTLDALLIDHAGKTLNERTND